MELAVSIFGLDPLVILTVAIGLGLVIFFHELGHFLVAKWCNVYVERFSIGFGRAILAKKWGETEYVVGWLPFGGYVKMLGQDDMDPGELADEEVAQDPRSYTAKNVFQRMAIISAGVIMNVVTALFFFVIAFSYGIQTMGPEVGQVLVGMPAWDHGLRTGDQITSIDGRQVNEFNDISRRTALSRGAIEVAGVHADGEKFSIKVTPEKSKILRKIGVAPVESLTVFAEYPGTAASEAKFEEGDTITAVNGEPVDTHLAFHKQLSLHAEEAVTLTVDRKVGETEDTTEETLTLPAQQFVDFGMHLSMGKIDAIQPGSPAADAGFQEGDLISKVSVGEMEEPLDVGNDLNPIRLTEFFSEHAGETVTVTVTREAEGGEAKAVQIEVIPEDRDPWSEPPIYEKSPLAIPSLGVAYFVVPKVFKVEEGSPAAEAGIGARDSLVRVELAKSSEVKDQDGLSEETSVIEIGEDNWAYVFWTMQEAARTRQVKLTIKADDSSEGEAAAAPVQEKTLDIQPAPVAGWYLPTSRGMLFQSQRVIMKAEDTSDAFSMGFHYTVKSIEDIYLTIRGLAMRDISPKGLSGPIGIAEIAYSFASLGIAQFVLFLGLISVNLAVINFLPILPLDGGHMVFLLWEGLSRKKPNERVIVTATIVGLCFVGGLMIFVIWMDGMKLLSRLF